jgi:hypothetical protein
MHLDNLSRGTAQSRGPACRITEGHDCQAKRRRCGENRRGATFLEGCCRAATQRSVTLTNASYPLWVKLRRTQPEQISSGLPLKADIARYSRHASKVEAIPVRGSDRTHCIFGICRGRPLTPTLQERASLVSTPRRAGRGRGRGRGRDDRSPSPQPKRIRPKFTGC